MHIKRTKEKVFVFAVAIIARFFLGYVFFGSIDVSALIEIARRAFCGTLIDLPLWNIFPVLPFYLWPVGLLSIKTSLPVAVCFKLIPILFDALLSLLIYDIVKKYRINHAFGAGLLYALSPVGLIITCIHGQWEAMQIFFFLLALYIREYYQNSYLKYFVYGALFAFSFLLKPLTLVFLLFFFVPFAGLKKELGAWWRWLLVLASMLMIAVALFFFVFKTHKEIALDALLNSPLVIALTLLALGLAIGFVFGARPWQYFSVAFKKHLGLQVAAVAGLLCMVAVAFACFVAYGFSVLHIFDKVLRYFNQGRCVFGLPFAYPFNQGLLALVLKNRFWIMGLIGLVALQYYKQRFDVYHSVLIALLCIFSFSGLSPQYLLWLVPLLLIIGFYRVAALFNFVCSVFFILYYANPMTNPEVPYQSMASFAALKPFSWLMPPGFLTSESLIPVINILGNYVLPIFFLSVLMMLVLGKRQTCMGMAVEHEQLLLGKQWYLLILLMLTTGIAVLMGLVDTAALAQPFNYIVDHRFDAYAVHFVNGFAVGDYGQLYLFNIVFLFGVFAMIWSVMAWNIKNS